MVVSSRSQQASESAAESLAARHSGAKVFAKACNVADAGAAFFFRECQIYGVRKTCLVVTAANVMADETSPAGAHTRLVSHVMSSLKL